MGRPSTDRLRIQETMPSVNPNPATGTNDCYFGYGINDKYATATAARNRAKKNLANINKPACELDTTGVCYSGYQTINKVSPGCCTATPDPKCIKAKTTTSRFGSSFRYDLVLLFLLIICIILYFIVF